MEWGVQKKCGKTPESSAFRFQKETISFYADPKHFPFGTFDIKSMVSELENSPHVSLPSDTLIS